MRGVVVIVVGYNFENPQEYLPLPQSTAFPETLAILTERVAALLAKDGVNQSGETVPVREETRKELEVLRDLIHELRA